MALEFRSIAAQVADALCAEIGDRVWTGMLPGERALAEKYQVSRKTLRKALAHLREQGLVTTGRSRGSEVCLARRRRRVATSPRIALLLPEPLEASRPYTSLWVNRLMVLLHDIGHPLEIHTGSKFYGQHAGRSLSRLCAAHPSRCWLIARSNRALQEWFVSSGVPAIITGSAHPGVRLPSVDIDHRALCRHSATLFLRHGHRRLALFLEPGGHAGDAESAAGFGEGVASKADAAEPLVCMPERTPGSIIRESKRILARSDPPTGWLVSNSYSYLTVLSYFASIGLRVPHDVSVVSRDAETFLRFMHPTPTYYSTAPTRYARAVHQAVKRVLAGVMDPFSIRIMPDLVPGSSVGPPRCV
jgi:DNA-binding LacI/PurR family transcriptional regulator